MVLGLDLGRGMTAIRSTGDSSPRVPRKEIATRPRRLYFSVRCEARVALHSRATDTICGGFPVFSSREPGLASSVMEIAKDDEGSNVRTPRSEAVSDVIRSDLHANRGQEIR
jgi:hypothetical protein